MATNCGQVVKWERAAGCREVGGVGSEENGGSSEQKERESGGRCAGGHEWWSEGKEHEVKDGHNSGRAISCLPH